MKVLLQGAKVEHPLSIVHSLLMRHVEAAGIAVDSRCCRPFRAAPPTPEERRAEKAASKLDQLEEKWGDAQREVRRAVAGAHRMRKRPGRIRFAVRRGGPR